MATFYPYPDDDYDPTRRRQVHAALIEALLWGLVVVLAAGCLAKMCSGQTLPEVAGHWLEVKGIPLRMTVSEPNQPDRQLRATLWVNGPKLYVGTGGGGMVTIWCDRLERVNLLDFAALDPNIYHEGTKGPRAR